MEMVEQMAKAMWERTHDGSWDGWGDGQDDSRRIYLADAHIGIEAIREPNMLMKQAGARVMPDYDPSIDDAAITWNAMIDAALHT